MASSSKKTKTDLIVRVRYQNPLPPPPFPPRFLNITTSPDRYATYDFLNPMMNERELPMSIDTELGMPLELGQINPGSFGDGKYWMGNRSEICPVGPPTAILDDEDAFLMDSVITQATTAAAGSSSVVIPPGGHVVAGVERKKLDVSWLRRTEYLSSEGGKMMPGASTAPIRPKAVIAEAAETRGDGVELSFAGPLGPLADLRHPTKSHLTAARVFDVLPDVELWANDLALVRYGEDPGEGKAGDLPRIGPDPRLPRAKIRAVQFPDEEQPRFSLYLPADNSVAMEYELRRMTSDLDFAFDPNLPRTDFVYVRDYQSATTRPVKSEFVFDFIKGPLQEGEEPSLAMMPSKRPRGAYFTPVTSATTLRKRRPRRNENPKAFLEEMIEEGTVFWDGFTVAIGGLDNLTEEELAERRKVLELVTPPMPTLLQ